MLLYLLQNKSHVQGGSEKELNNLIYGSLFYIIMYRSYKLLKRVEFLDHTVGLHVYNTEYCSE